MNVTEILRRTEGGISLFLATDAELATAKNAATREIQRIEIEREIKTRQRKHITRIDGLVKTRPPRKHPIKPVFKKEWR